MRKLEEGVWVAGQVRPEELAALPVRIVVNNRPDGEEPDQPTSAEMEAGAKAAGLGYRHIPIAGGFSPDDVQAMAAALDQGPALAFCRSGTRSTYLWALARASRGADADALIAKAAEAGYDLSPIRRLLGPAS